jgi:hypothetical protein
VPTNDQPTDLLTALQRSIERARAARIPTTATCRAGRRIDTGQAPTFIHVDDDTECDHGRDVATDGPVL